MVQDGTLKLSSIQMTSLLLDGLLLKSWLYDHVYSDFKRQRIIQDRLQKTGYKRDRLNAPVKHDPKTMCLMSQRIVSDQRTGRKELYILS